MNAPMTFTRPDAMLEIQPRKSSFSEVHKNENNTRMLKGKHPNERW